MCGNLSSPNRDGTRTPCIGNIESPGKPGKSHCIFVLGGGKLEALEVPINGESRETTCSVGMW